MASTMNAVSSLPFNEQRSWVTQLKQLDQSSWVGLADGNLKLLDAATWSLSPVSLTLNSNTFIQPWSPHELLIASGQHLSLCDVRQPQPAFSVQGKGKPYSSLAVQPSQHLAAVGTELASHEALIELWDIRQSKPRHAYHEVHSDDVASLTFQTAPGRDQVLLSGSTDGLFSITDTAIQDEDDAVLGVGQVGASVKNAVWCSPLESSSLVYALTDMQTVSLFTGHEPELLQDYGDLRDSPSLQLPSGFTCDYVIDFDSPSRLMLGSNTAGFVEVDISNHKSWTPLRHYQGTHTPDEVIRCAVTSSDGSYTLSGGEDGLIAVWNHGKPQDTTQEDTEMAQKEQHTGKKKKSKKHRYNPY